MYIASPHALPFFILRCRASVPIVDGTLLAPAAPPPPPPPLCVVVDRMERAVRSLISFDVRIVERAVFGCTSFDELSPLVRVTFN